MPDKTPRSTISEALKAASTELKPKRITCAADKDLGQLEAEILLAHVLRRDRSWLFAYPYFQLPASSFKKFRSLVARRKKYKPIAYLIGHKDFYGLTFHVSRATLIPRPESELLVDLARKALFAEPSLGDLVWDAGTGSGAIALAIASHILPRRVIATDTSTAALAVAKQNARRLKIKNVTFLKSDLLDSATRRLLKKTKPSRLVIVANLPYLPLNDKQKLNADVVKYEPSSALFVGKNGTELIEKLLRQLATFDIHFSHAFFEFDPPQSKKLRAFAKLLFPHATVKIHPDLAKRNRILEIQRSP